MDMLTEYSVVLVFLFVGVFFVAAGIVVAALIRPSRPNPRKNSTYESGEEPIGSPWIQFNNRFYIIALAFIIFDVELVMLFPWAVVFKEMGWFAFWGMIVFAFILALGLAYDWAKGLLDWEKPQPQIPVLSDLVTTREEYLKNIKTKEN
ncbi:MAG: NADH-quinone oxidoreductase subunit A [Candidatus Kapabacteria bacterium]|nr:NADH-quinone oxidoreductase subunit A [Ignavibacteriota bacterium]MCW5885598.1 NADH-quinone oxidoreductase subunit A [Candidatus Kapabacteria bacterium]